MAYTVGNRSISKIGVIGSGQIGPDIALHMTKVMQPFDVPVVVVDVAEAALTAGRAKLEKKIDKGVESGAFKPERARAMKDNTTFTSDYDELKGADFVVEAATEDLKIKHLIFGQLEGIVSSDCIIASNSSHMEPEVIFSEAQHKARTCVIHYFFPAERNPMVEIVPSADSDTGMIDSLMSLYEEIGKVPIKVGSRYGYAMDPIFEGLFHAACLCVEEGLGTVKEVDSVARKVLKQGIGPFTAMNLTGGNPITHVGLQHYQDKFYRWAKPSKLMEEAMEMNEAWDVAKRGEKVDVPDEAFAKIRDRMLGAYFGIVGEILDSGISNVADLEMGVQTALVTKPPFEYMNEVGIPASRELVEQYAADHKGFPVPECIATRNDPWEIPLVICDQADGVAVLTIRRPAVLNALNKEVDSVARKVLKQGIGPFTAMNLTGGNPSRPRTARRRRRTATATSTSSRTAASRSSAPTTASHSAAATSSHSPATGASRAPACACSPASRSRTSASSPARAARSGCRA
jgi:enoyl-CoA hydratase/3-hydroxyacyl-CoA dehydrogenase